MAKKRAQLADGIVDETEPSEQPESEAIAGDRPEEALPPHRLDAPYAYYTDDGVLKAWGHNHVVTDPDEIQHLRERGARLSEIKS